MSINKRTLFCEINHCSTFCQHFIWLQSTMAFILFYLSVRHPPKVKSVLFWNLAFPEVLSTFIVNIALRFFGSTRYTLNVLQMKEFSEANYLLRKYRVVIFRNEIYVHFFCVAYVAVIYFLSTMCVSVWHYTLWYRFKIVGIDFQQMLVLAYLYFKLFSICALKIFT